MINLENFDWGWMENPEVTDLKPLLIKEVFEERIYEKFFTIDEGDIVLDIGSSVGPFAYSILNKKPKHIYCLEPSKEQIPTLEKNMSTLSSTIINKGISDIDGKNKFILFGEKNGLGESDSITFSSLIKEYKICLSPSKYIPLRDDSSYLIYQFHQSTFIFEYRYRCARDKLYLIDSVFRVDS